MNTNLSLTPNSTNQVFYNHDSSDIKEPVGQLILQLAINSLPPDIAVPFTLEKMKLLKAQGVSLSGKLHQNHVRHLVSELGVLSLKLQLSEMQSKSMDADEVAHDIQDFSAMSDEELKLKEAALEQNLQHLETQAYIARLQREFASMLQEIKTQLPFLHFEALQSLFEKELELTAKRDSNQLSTVGAKFIDHVRKNSACLAQFLEKSRHHIQDLDLAAAFKLRDLKEFIELQVLALVLEPSAELQSNMHKDPIEFEAAANQLYANLTTGNYVKDLSDQLRNLTNHALWDQFLDEFHNIERVAKDKFSLVFPLTKKEIKKIKSLMSQQMPDLTKNWSLSEAEFKKQYIDPVFKARNDQLLKLKNKENNLISLKNEILNKYEEFLKKSAQEAHQFTPSEPLIQLQVCEILKAFMPESAIDEPQENFLQYINEIKPHLFSKEAEHDWLIKVATEKKVNELKQNPDEFAKRLWKKEIGSELDLSPIRKEKLQAWISATVQIASKKHLNQEDLQALVINLSEIRAEINKQELLELKQRLLQDPEVTSEVTHEIMSDWKVIGSNIQHDLSLLDKDAQERVIKIAKNRSQFKQILEHVKHDLDHRVLTPNQAVIESKYKKLKDLMVEFPQFNNTNDSEQHINLIINKALLQQELIKRKKQSYNRGSQAEIQLLTWLKFSPNEDFQCLDAQQLIENMLESTQLNEQSTETIKKEIRAAELTARLKAAGVADGELTNTKKLIEAYDNLKAKMEKHYMPLAEMAVPLDKYNALPKIQQLLMRKRYSQVMSKINSRLKFLFAKDDLKKDLILDPAVFEDKYLKKLFDFDQDEKLNEKFKSLILNSMTETMKFYDKWHSKLAVDAIQGLEDLNEVLTAGVCLAKCLRVGSYEKNHPQDDVGHIGGERIASLDRYEQARYKRAFDETRFLKVKGVEAKEVSEQLMTVPKEVLNRYGYKKVNWLSTLIVEQNDKTSPPFAQQVMNQLNDCILDPSNNILKQLELTNGVVFITLEGKDWGHALHARFDFSRGIFRLHDPNIGIFELPIEKNKLQTGKELSLLFKEVIENLYEDANQWHLYQLI